MPLIRSTPAFTSAVVACPSSSVIAIQSPVSPTIVAFKNYGATMDTMRVKEAGKAISASAVARLAVDAVESQRWRVPAELDLLDRDMLNYLFRVELPKVYVLANKDVRAKYGVVNMVTDVMRGYTPEAVARAGKRGARALSVGIDSALRGRPGVILQNYTWKLVFLQNYHV